MRVVQVSFFADPQQRDAETLLRVWPTLHGVAAGVQRAGIDVTIVQAAARRQTLIRDGVQYYFVPSAVDEVVQCVVSLAPDVVHVHGLQYPWALWRLLRAIPRTPVLIQDHAMQLPHWWWRVVWRFICGSVRGMIFSAQEQTRPFFASGMFPSDLPVFEVLEGSSSFTPGDRDIAQRESGIAGNPCLLWTGHLNENKDPLTMLDAVRFAAEQLPQLRLWCCFGQAPLLEAVQRRIAEDAVLRECVTLLGARAYEDMQPLFRAADFFVQTSHRESTGYSVIEALSCGATPLVTDIPSFRRITDRGRVGSLTPVGDARALGEAIVAWANRDRAMLRQSARAWFESALSFDVIGRQLREAYFMAARTT